MRIFVASWFFPPSTSSEGIVTYKLLRNSRYQYDVVSSKCDKWGYNSILESDADNVCVIPVDTDELEVWRDECVRIFEERHAEQAYDAIMTRCMPNESLEVGLAIKKRYPALKWICSLADPVANNPYWRFAIGTNPELTKREKTKVLEEMSLPRSQWSTDWLKHPSNSVSDQFYWKDIQDQAMSTADMLIAPVLEQRDFMDPEGTAANKFLIVPHSFDEDFYAPMSVGEDWEEDRIHLTYTGYSDSLRSLNPFLDAVKWIKDRYPDVLKKLKLHFIGNYPRELIDRALAWEIEDVFDFSGNASYLETLALMQKSDWLLHVDAWFGELGGSGGSVFFAGKLADYMGARRPILALTGRYSPADNMVAQYGGVSLLTWETVELARTLIRIATGNCPAEINEGFRMRYNARNVAAAFDDALVKKGVEVEPSTEERVFGGTYSTEKLLTICVPSYNAQKTIRRAMDSLLAVKDRDSLEIIVVDDGSRDGTAAIGREYVENYPETVMLVSKPNGGHGSGINQGIQRAQGKYFRVVDSDDWVDSDSLQYELDFIRECKKDPDLIYTPYHLVNQKTGQVMPWPMPEDLKYKHLYTFDELLSKVGVRDLYFTMASTSFRTELLRGVGLKLREKTFYTDSEFILKPIPAVDTVVFLSKYVYKYLQAQAEQSISKTSFVRNYKDHEQIVSLLLMFEQKTKMRSSHREYLRNVLNDHLNTNYRILLEFDPDIQRGLNKAKKFDLWLKENAPDYYDWTQKQVPLARAARAANYRAASFASKRAACLKPKQSLTKQTKHSIKVLLHSPVFMNRFTMQFVKDQKDNNGPLYRTYMKFK